MIVGRRMTRDPKTVAPGDTLSRAAEIMRRHRIGHLPVVEDGRLVGILSDTDIRNASLPPGHAGALPGDRAVREAMRAEVWSLAPEDSVEDALQIICRQRFGALPVLEGDRVVGIITRIDLLRAFSDVLNLGEVCVCLDVALPRTLDRFEEMVAAVRGLGVGLRSATVAPHKGSERMIARLRLDTLDARMVAEALKARGFDVRELPDAI